MVAHDLRQGRPLIGQRAGLVVQQPGSIAPTGHSSGKSLRRQFHGVFIHNAPQQDVSALHGGKPRRQVQRLRHRGIIEKGHRVAVAGHGTGVNDLPSQQRGKRVGFVVTGYKLPCHGIRTSFPG